MERVDPTGADFFWLVALDTPNEGLAQEAMNLILNISYLHLAPRLKKDPSTLHKKFINECYKRLETQVPCLKTNSSSGSNTPLVALTQLASLSPDKK